MEDLDEIPQASPTTRNVEKEVTDADGMEENWNDDSFPQSSKKCMPPRKQDDEPNDPQTKIKLNAIQPTDSCEHDDLGIKANIEYKNALHPTDSFVQFHVLAPAYYDKYGQLVMFTAHGLGTPIYLVAPAPVLVSSYDNKEDLENMVLTPAYFDRHQKKYVTGDPRDTFKECPASSEPPALALDSESSNHKVQYQVLAPGYYNKHNQLVMGDRRGKDAPVYLVPPAPVLIRASYNNKDQAEFMSQYIDDVLLKPAFYHQERWVINGDPRCTEAPACLVPPVLSLVHGFCNQQEDATVRMKAMTNNKFSQNKSSQQVCQEALDIEGTERKAECPRQSSPVLD